MILGLVGKNSAGKGEVANFLKEIGYTYYSLSDVLRNELKKQGMEITRDNLINEGRAMRTRGGQGVLAELIRPKLKSDQNYAIDSIRNPGEVEALRKERGFFLINVVAQSQLRFERMCTRSREGDPKTLAEFEKLEAKESDSSTPVAQQVEQTESMADFTVENNGTLEELYERMRGIMRDVTKKNSRPNWDQYFMEIARAAARRSNCSKRHVAAVLVRDKRVISTGYNGTPRGVMNCDEGGCPRCNSFQKSGQNLSECLCSHAEENAIVQAAYHGSAVTGSTLYTTFSPCLLCTKMILNSGILEVVYSKAYTLDETSLHLLREAGVVVRQIEEDCK